MTTEDDGWIGADNWIIAALRKKAAEADAAKEREDRLRAALAFAASCIKAGEPWTPECERIIDGALKGRTE